MNRYHRGSLMERFAFLDYVAATNPHISDVQFTNPYGRAKYDFSCSSGTTSACAVEFVGEIKVRDNERIDHEKWMLEHSKLEALLKLDAPSLYLNFFHDGYALWRLNKNMLETLKPELYDGKQVYYLSSSDAIEVHEMPIDYGRLYNSATRYYYSNDTAKLAPYLK